MCAKKRENSLQNLNFFIKFTTKFFLDFRRVRFCELKFIIGAREF